MRIYFVIQTRSVLRPSTFSILLFAGLVVSVSYTLDGYSMTLTGFPIEQGGRLFLNFAFTTPLFPWGAIILPQIVLYRVFFGEVEVLFAVGAL